MKGGKSLVLFKAKKVGLDCVGGIFTLIHLSSFLFRLF